MATYGRTVRRGLPRSPGGESWPPADATAPVESVVAAVVVAEVVPAVAEAPVIVEAVAVVEAPAAAVAAPPPAVGPAAGATLRRGLPRVAGGEPWPPAGQVAVAAAVAAPAAVVTDAAAAVASDAAPVAAAPASAPAATPARVVAAAGTGAALRRGLPRAAGGEPWPAAGFAPDLTVAAAPVVEVVAEAAPAVRAGLPRPGAGTAPAAAASAPTTAVAVAEPTGPLAPLPFTRTAWAGKAARTRPAPKPEPKRYGPFTRGQWAGAAIVAGGGLLFAAAMAVLAVRWFLSLEFMQDFLTTYPGEYHLPEGAPVGFPSWLGWQHFFNVFLMVLIIRSGLQVRNEKRPAAFWSPRGNPKRKISLSLWFHQSLDILWLVNGVIFIVLLFVSGQWMRVIPTSWEVIPNAISAALQYVSLDWPTENGWVNYNSLQQIAYFATIFIAAPLAAITGVRMSGIWPKNMKALDKAYPVEWARAVHFPVMLYFVLFIFVHVMLVLTTGALRNLNHMYAAQGSVDPNAYADNWLGFWMFAASLVVIAAAWVAARPLVLAPIAKLFGKVSAR
ncbi:hypothetical protein ASD65_09695 [Microbacterium sp. Root61]|uniref:cytochrome b/b6 domain-containing protein n=1 Tax=Microbacterium sp. Root61 TaxID=1736570 RepID=UPI0006F2C13F|nr:cytochrome b/b6 domain-containing protein [Microbacterium sp. Root61]KRA24653.1 hypothetical protein ASD65_09695 [Microbacterium sp. Root61]